MSLVLSMSLYLHCVFILHSLVDLRGLETSWKNLHQAVKQPDGGISGLVFCDLSFLACFNVFFHSLQEMVLAGSAMGWWSSIRKVWACQVVACTSGVANEKHFKDIIG